MGQVGWVAAFVVAALLLSGCSNGTLETDQGAAPARSVDAPIAGTSSSGGATTSSSKTTSNAPPPVVDVGRGKGGIDGVVVDAVVKPIAGAVVLLKSLNVSAITTSEGRFVFDGLEPGSYIVNVTHADYKPSQATADVKGGDPYDLKVVLEATRNLRPYVEQQKATLFVSSGYCTPVMCNKVMSGKDLVTGVGDSKYFEVNDFPTTLQAEITWDPTVSPLGDNGRLDCSLFGDDSAGDTQALDASAVGPAPLTVRMAGDWVDEESGLPVRAHAISCELGSATGAVPVSAMVQQQADLYVHLFYNFVPDAGWTFIGDGDYPVPP